MSAPGEKKCPRCHQTVGQYEYGEFLGNNKVRLYWKCASCYLEYDGSTHDITPDENPFAIREDKDDDKRDLGEDRQGRIEQRDG